MNILFLANLAPNKLGSMEEYALFLSRELQRRGDVCFLAFIAEPDTSLRSAYEAAGAKIIIVDYEETLVLRNTGAMFRQMYGLYRLIRENRIDLVHIHFIRLTNPLLWGVFCTGARLVFTDHASGPAFSRKFLKQAVSKSLHFFLSPRIARYVGVSDFVRDRIRQTHHIDGPKLITLYNGVNVERFVPGDMVAARAALQLPRHAKVLCSVAMHIPEKGIHCLVEAAAILVHEYRLHDLVVIMAGEGPFREELERLVRERRLEDHVRFLGRRSDVNRLLAAADVLVVPSLWAEAFGLIIAEAMASGRPVVATRVGGIPELIEDGKTGLLVEPGDSQGLACRIVQLLEDPDLRQRVVTEALDKVREQFNLALQVDKQVRLYEEVLNAQLLARESDETV